MPARRPGLSKSKLVSYRQCPKRLFLEVHGAEYGINMEEAQLDPMRARHGADVGNVARALYGPGTLIGEAGGSLAECLQETQAALANAKPPLFEATVQHDGLLIKADVLTRSRGVATLVEVKSSTLNTYEKFEVKRDTLRFDAAVQAWALERSGVQLRSIKLAMVDSRYMYVKEGDYSGLLREVDVTVGARAMEDEVIDAIAGARKTLTGKLPNVEMGPQCNSPYECPFQDFCAGPDQPEFPAHRLLTLRNRKNREVVEHLDQNGWTDLRQVPKKLLSHALDVRIWTAVKTGKPQLEPAAREWARDLTFPRYYIDFETIQFAVPIWPGTRPYDQLPFQWSCHIEHADGRLEHAEFLDDGGKLPLRTFAESLLEVLGRGKGPVVVYNQAFEARCLSELATRFQDLAPRIDKILARMVDLLPVMRDHYYHRDMQGSWSIKDVLSTIDPEMGYERLSGVQEGNAAQFAFLQLIDPATRNEDRTRLRNELLTYCQHDTLAMVRIMEYLTA